MVHDVANMFLIHGIQIALDDKMRYIVDLPNVSVSHHRQLRRLHPIGGKAIIPI